jgi:uncharacterized protein YndB with AHSA1/START domain
MEQRITVEVAAPVERVWEVLSDIDHWSEWTESVTSARRLDDGPLRPGSRAELSQPRIPKGVWTVTEVEAGRSFTWEQAGPGVRTTARHRLEPLPDGGTRVHLVVEQAGWLGQLVGRLYARLTDRYLAMESAGLKARAEG